MRGKNPSSAFCSFTNAWGWDMLGPNILHFIAYPAGAISAQEQRQQQQSQEPTALQLHGSLSHKKQYELTQVPSLNEVNCSGWKINSGRYSMTSKQNLIPQGWSRKSLVQLLGPMLGQHWVSIATKLRSQPRSC